MEIVFHAHRAVISDRLRARAESAMSKLAERYAHTVDATIRFEQDGPIRTVEVVMRGHKSRRWVAKGSARTYGPALTSALRQLQQQLIHDKRVAKDRAHLARRA